MFNKAINIFTVYVLYSESFHKHYTELTSDFEKRIISHNEFGTKGWTIKYRPWKLILREDYSTKSEALQSEKWLKSGIGMSLVKGLPH